MSRSASDLDVGAAGTEVLALDIGGTKLAAGVVDATGGIRERRTIATDRAAGAERVLERALGLVQELLAVDHGGAGPPRALGMSTHGLTREDRVDLAPTTEGWAGLRIPSELRRHFPQLRAWIVNDVKAATLAEMRWGALRGVSDGLYVNLGTGFAVGIVSDGRLVQGSNGAAGEVGYLVASLDQLAARRPGQALLEERIGGRGVELWTERELGRSVTVAQLLERSRHDPRARHLWQRLLDEIALWVANLAIVVDPACIVLGGGLVRSASELCQRTQEMVTSVAPFPVPVRMAHFGAESALLGAGAVALSGESDIHAGGAEGGHEVA